MKKVPEIAKEEEYMLPKTPKEGVFYIDNFGFKLKVTSPFKIFYLPEEDVHELCYFEIKKGKCLTHEYYASDTWMLKKQMGEKEYSKYVTPELEQYIEEMGYLIPDYYRDYSISPQNGKLIFEQKGNELKLGNFIKCEYKKEKYPDWVPQNGWESDPNTIGYIHIYTDTHEFEDDFYFEILDFDINQSKG